MDVEGRPNRIGKVERPGKADRHHLQQRHSGLFQVGANLGG
jgi:hypothetical protein